MNSRLAAVVASSVSVGAVGALCAIAAMGPPATGNNTTMETELAATMDLHCRALRLIGPPSREMPEVLTAQCGASWASVGPVTEPVCGQIADIDQRIRQRLFAWNQRRDGPSRQVALATGLLRVGLRTAWVRERCGPVPPDDARYADVVAEGYANTIVEWVLNADGSREFDPSAEALAQVPEISTSSSESGEEPTD